LVRHHGRLGYRHALLREAAYVGLADPTSAHDRVATALGNGDPAEIARHLTLAGRPADAARQWTAAAAYALYAAPAGVVRVFDHWNVTRLVVDGAHVEHWLNGRKVVEYELWSPDWHTKVAASKFAAFAHYGLAKKGYIGIQGDHSGPLVLRNIRIRELP